MKIIMAAVFLFFIYAAPVYSLMPSDIDAYEEKGRIIESVTPVRGEKEKNLHPFVQDIEQSAQNTAIKPEIIKPGVTSYTVDSKPDVRGVNFIFISIILAAFFLAYFFIRPKSK